MTPAGLWRAIKQWGPFALRTAAYGTFSITLGPLTRDRRASLWAMQRWCRSSTSALRIAVNVSGLENVPTQGAYVYCTNHQSIVDIIVLGSVLPGDYKWATKRSIMRVPFLGWHLSIAGHVPVDRGAGEHAVAETVKRFVQVLRDGKPLLIFPEGTRSEDGRMQPFKNGGFYAAVRAGVPIVPVALNGTHRLMKRGGTDTGEELVKPVHVKVGPPVHPGKDGSESDLVIDLRDRTFDAVADLLESIGGLTNEGGRRHAESVEVRASA